MTVLIVGVSGKLGSDLFELFKRDQIDVIGFNSSDLNITEEIYLRNKIKKIKPQYIINAAAYNEVENAEKNIKKAFRVNAFGPKYLASICSEINSVLIHVSTDYVFDGSNNYYVETDVPNPLNIYGISKYTGEQLVMNSIKNYYIIRTSALFGPSVNSNKSNFVNFIINKAKNKSEINVVNDQYTSPTYTYDLGKSIKYLIDEKKKYGIYHITNNGYCSWFEFAETIIKYSNLKCKLEPISTIKSGSVVNRPEWSVLETNSDIKLPNWEDALNRYINILKLD